MESILARALEYTLKYWLKSFSRDQFKLQGRIAQLSNLDINGEALHSSMGLPPALNVTTAKVGKLEIMLPSISNVQTEPIVVRVDRLDVVLEEKTELDACSSPSSAQSSSTSTKSSSYGFADKISDGMTLEVRTVNLLLETRRGPQCQGGAIWASPMASITIHNLFLYTTNEKWQVVNLKEARDFNNNKNFIYVFRKLEWDSLSVDLLPHPDMFMGAQVSSSHESMNKRDVDGAKRVFFGGERFVEGISGQANITIQRTELNSPLGLEVQLHITEAVCPALSEPGLRAFLRFLTGLYVCLNRDVNPEVQEQHSEAAGRSLISITVDHIFFCIKDAEFRLELLMQSLFFSRASVSDGETAKGLTCVMIAGLFLRDTFSHPPCTLVQPSMQAATGDCLEIPEFGENFCPPIYPMRDQQWLPNVGIPLVCLHSFQIKPSPSPPSFASQTVINCQPLMIYLQEESCLRICSFLADGVVISPGSVLPDYSVNSLKCDLKELDLTVPLEMKFPSGSCTSTYGSFTAARLQIGSMFFSDSPSLKLRLLNMERDPACFCLWEDQPVDASQKKWTAGALHLTLSLETSNDQTSPQSSSGLSSGLWRCVELRNACIEVAMVTADGSPLIRAPPPGGVVRVGVACQQYMSSTSVEQLFFVLDLYAYLGRVSDKIVMVGDDNRPKVNRTEISNEKLMEKVPSDTAVSLKVNDIEFRFLESSSLNIPAITLAQFVGSDLFITAAHRTFGGAIGVSFNIRWENIRLDCIDAEGNSSCDTIMASNGFPQLRTIFWVNNPRIHQSNGNVLTTPFLDINIEHMIPYIASNGVCHSLSGDLELHSLSISTCIAGVRLGGGLRYTEELLHRFGILGPDGGPGEGLTKGLDNLSAGPLSKLFKPAPIVDKLDDGSLGGGKDINFWNLGIPDDADISIEFRDWLFALEGVHEMEQNSSINTNCVDKKGRCWHTTFKTLKVRSSSSAEHKQHSGKKSRKRLKYPVELVTVSIEGLQTLKPQVSDGMLCNGSYGNGVAEIVNKYGGIDLEVHMVTTQDDVDNEIIKWTVENVKVAIKEPIEVVVTKDELQCIAFLYQSEVDSMGRIAAGILRALKLEKCVGQEAVDQLSNLGSEGFSRILSQGKFSTRVGLAPPLFKTGKRLNSSIEFTVTSLEEALLDSQAHCDSLVSELDNSELSHHVKQLSQKLDRMQNLLTRLRTQV